MTSPTVFTFIVTIRLLTYQFRRVLWSDASGVVPCSALRPIFMALTFAFASGYMVLASKFQALSLSLRAALAIFGTTFRCKKRIKLVLVIITNYKLIIILCVINNKWISKQKQSKFSSLPVYLNFCYRYGRVLKGLGLGSRDLWRWPRRSRPWPWKLIVILTMSLSDARKCRHFQSLSANFLVFQVFLGLSLGQTASTRSLSSFLKTYPYHLNP